ncbi:MAG: cobalamin biosynthesis protein [Pseudomonadota bacterium]
MRVAGIGCRAETPSATLRGLLSDPQGIDLVASLLTRTAQVRPVAEAMGLRFLAVDDIALRGIVTPTISARIAARFGAGSVAEATALVAAGRNARIVETRRISPDATATIAIAEGDGP